LKCSAKSGGFGQKLADFKAYGLLEGRGTFHVSDLAIKATYGTDKERSEALDAAVNKIELWRLIYAKWRTNIPVDTFWIDLAGMAGVERSESKKEADNIRKAYMDDAKYLLTVKAPPETPEQEKDESGTETEAARDRRKRMDTTYEPSPAFVHIKYPGYDVRIDLHDANSLDIVDSLLKAIKAKITPPGNTG
jgi:hypothetical protein